VWAGFHAGASVMPRGAESASRLNTTDWGGTLPPAPARR